MRWRSPPSNGYMQVRVLLSVLNLCLKINSNIESNLHEVEAHLVRYAQNKTYQKTQSTWYVGDITNYISEWLLFIGWCIFLELLVLLSINLTRLGIYSTRLKVEQRFLICELRIVSQFVILNLSQVFIKFVTVFLFLLVSC